MFLITCKKTTSKEKRTSIIRGIIVFIICFIFFQEIFAEWGIKISNQYATQVYFSRNNLYYFFLYYFIHFFRPRAGAGTLRLE